MLRALELYLLPTVDAALPAAVEVVHGPFAVVPPWPPARRVVDIHAVRLDVHDVPPPKTVDRPAFTFQTTTWPIDGATSSFTLPPALAGSPLVDVEAPAGYPAEPGNDYYLDGSTIRFFRAPTGPGSVTARVRVAEAAGYARRGPATVTLDVTAYTQDLSTADPLLHEALQVVLVQLHRAPYFAVPPAAGLGTSVRFTDFRPHVLHLERRHTERDNIVACMVRLELVGELDLLVASGAPEPVDLIARIDGEVTVDGGDDESDALEIHIELADDA